MSIPLLGLSGMLCEDCLMYSYTPLGNLYNTHPIVEGTLYIHRCHVAPIYRH